MVKKDVILSKIIWYFKKKEVYLQKRGKSNGGISMKGFIEIHQVETNTAVLVNVKYIDSVIQSQDYTGIYVINDKFDAWKAEESYEEIVAKIRQAMED